MFPEETARLRAAELRAEAERERSAHGPPAVRSRAGRAFSAMIRAVARKCFRR
ncbi:hypothetical protein [Actinopolyspora mortivallis]|uniref:hypothetical protein n=1 Tax=Actinopolyspora mortivallis TaxID=33906 RepID=UPI00035D4EE1|nr:hypothetical protein [Actinopolyspora mortivallis]